MAQNRKDSERGMRGAAVSGKGAGKRPAQNGKSAARERSQANYARRASGGGKAAGVAQRKNTGGAQRKIAGGAAWQGRRGGSAKAMAAAILAVGLVIVLVAYFVDVSGIFTTGAVSDGKVSGVRINELMAENTLSLITETGDVPDWIEIANGGSDTVNLKGWGLMLESRPNKLFSFPEMRLAPGECVLVYADGLGKGMHAPFKLSASGGDTLLLINDKGQVADGVALVELAADEAYARGADGSWGLVNNATPGAKNYESGKRQSASGIQLRDDALELSEAMSANSIYWPDENGRCHDYVEIHNRSGESVNLQGWFLSDASDKLKKWSFPEVILPANGYLAVHLSGESRTENPNHLHADFKLSSEGESVYLSRPDGQTVSVVNLPALEENQAYSLANGRWDTELAPSPGFENTWSGAAEANNQRFGDGSGKLCISEIMALPSDQEYDWIEIYNGTGQTVDLSGYGLSDNGGRPRKWQFPKGATIQPGAYMGVYLSGQDVSAIGDLLNANFALSGDGGYTVSLSDANGNVLDAAYLPKQYSGLSYARFSGRRAFPTASRPRRARPIPARTAGSGPRTRNTPWRAGCSKAARAFRWN